MSVYTKYVIKNLNREKIVKQVVKLARLKSVKIFDDQFTFTINKKYNAKVDRILETKNAKILMKQQVGFMYFLKTSVLRIGVLIPAVLFVVFLLFCNNYIFQIKIMGNEMVSDEKIMQILQSEGINGIVKKDNINIQNIQNAILKEDKISLVSAIIKGNSLIINIKEKIYNTEYEDKDGFKPLLSEFDGIITEMCVVQGTSLVNVGQTVKKGQELVAPYTIDTSGNKLSIRPLADIKADVFYTLTEEIPDTKIQTIDTGNVVTARKITLNNAVVYFENVNVGYRNFRVEEVETIITNNNILPLKYVTYRYIETKIVQIDDYFKQSKQQILQNIGQKTRLLLNEYDIIKEEYNTITSNAGINRVTYTILVNKSIC